MIDVLIEFLIKNTGADIVSVKLIVSLLLGYPFALVYVLTVQYLPKVAQHLYFLIFGLGIYYWNFGHYILNPIFAILFNYILVHTIPKKSAVAIAFFFNTSHLMIGYYRKNLGEYDINWTTPHCVLTLRLIGLVWDIYDGSRPVETLSPYQKANSLREIPTLLEFMAFSFVPTAFLVGPQFSMVHYRKLINNTLQPKTYYPDGRPRSSLWPKLSRGVLRFLIGSFYIGIFVFLSPYINLERFSSHAFMHEWNFGSRMIYMVLFAKLMLGRYLGVWLISEGSCVIAGLGCTGKVNSEGAELSHDACANVHVREYELAVNCDELVESFNANTNKWMLEYVYKRLRFLNNRYISQIVTLFYLALWHGSYSGYYVNFFIEFITVAFEKDFLMIINRSWLLPHLETPGGKVFCKVVGKIFILLIIGQPLTAFNLLRFKDWYPVLATVYFSGFIFLLWPIFRPLVKMILIRKTTRNKDEGGKEPQLAPKSSEVNPTAEVKKEN